MNYTATFQNMILKCASTCLTCEVNKVLYTASYFHKEYNNNNNINNLFPYIVLHNMEKKVVYITCPYRCDANYLRNLKTTLQKSQKS